MKEYSIIGRPVRTKDGVLRGTVLLYDRPAIVVGQLTDRSETTHAASYYSDFSQFFHDWVFLVD